MSDYTYEEIFDALLETGSPPEGMSMQEAQGRLTGIHSFPIPTYIPNMTTEEAIKQVRGIIHKYMESRFEELLGEWIRSTSHHSALQAIDAHPARQEIVSMGKQIVPTVLQNIDRYTIALSGILVELTGENPVKKSEHVGRVKFIAEDWKVWGREKGYIA